MIDRTHKLLVRRQCQLQKLARATAYYHPMPVSETTLTLMRRIDALHLQYPFAGTRLQRDLLRHEARPLAGGMWPPRCTAWAWRLCIASRLSAAASPAIGSTPISCAT